jgi:beta-lactamase class A
MHLPQTNLLPDHKLASVYNSTSATYKFYWLLAIMELVEEGQLKLDKRQLFARMISNSWYTVNYFHVSF